jgi:hypothetical protein
MLLAYSIVSRSASLPEWQAARLKLKTHNIPMAVIRVACRMVLGLPLLPIFTRRGRDIARKPRLPALPARKARRLAVERAMICFPLAREEYHRMECESSGIVAATGQVRQSMPPHSPASSLYALVKDYCREFERVHAGVCRKVAGAVVAW